MSLFAVIIAALPNYCHQILCCNLYLNFVYAVYAGKNKRTAADTAKCGDRSVEHALTWRSARLKLLLEVQRRLKVRGRR